MLNPQAVSAPIAGEGNHNLPDLSLYSNILMLMWKVKTVKFVPNRIEYEESVDASDSR